jgi:hypothetical protein
MLTLMMLTAAAATPAPAITLPEGPALTQAVTDADTRFFSTYFEKCEPSKIDAMLTADFEMYHDRGGVVATASAPFVADYARQCEEKKKPDAWRSRRELVAGTLVVSPVPGFGAIEQGEHVFYERRGDGPEKKVGWARFTQLWKFDGTSWRLARVFSYDHKALASE